MAACPTRFSAPEDALSDALAVQALMDAGRDGIDGLVATARASYYGEEGARKGRVLLVAKRPASMQLTALSPTDDMIAVMATDGVRFMSFERGSPYCAQGPACTENVGRLIPIALPPAQIVRVLFGDAPRFGDAPNAMSWDADVGAYRLTYEFSGGHQFIWVRHGTGDVVRMRLFDTEGLVADIAFEAVKTVSGHRLPHTIRVLMPKRSVDLKLDYRDATLGETIDDEAFTLPCPEGTTPSIMPCDTRP